MKKAFVKINPTLPRFNILNQLNPRLEQIHYLGNIDLLNKPTVAVVGTRKITSYGRGVIDLIVPELVKSGLNIISGLAYGVDAYAHRVTLRNSGQCIAVLPRSLENIYPVYNQQLAEEILDAGGLMISEYDESIVPDRYHFVLRNRIIAGLADFVLVIEAAEKSGSLATAKFALDLGIEVGAVPGPIMSPYSTGVNLLLKNGANLITDARDILYNLQLKINLEYFDLPIKTELNILDKINHNLTESHANLYSFISQGSSKEGELLALSNWTLEQLACLLNDLELDGYILNRDNLWCIKI